MLFSPCLPLFPGIISETHFVDSPSPLNDFQRVLHYSIMQQDHVKDQHWACSPQTWNQLLFLETLPLLIEMICDLRKLCLCLFLQFVLHKVFTCVSSSFQKGRLICRYQHILMFQTKKYVRYFLFKFRSLQKYCIASSVLYFIPTSLLLVMFLKTQAMTELS